MQRLPSFEQDPHSPSPPRSASSEQQAFAGAGEMAELIRAFDWGATPLGPAEAWSPTLRTMVRFLLANGFPMMLWWGPEYVCIYNDPYRPVLGAKHPRALGTPVREVWSEIWHVLKPLVDGPFRGGPPTWNDDLELELNRHGYFEEAHFTIAYSAVPDDTAAGGNGGVLATIVETTAKVVGERRVAALRDLAARATDGRTADDACKLAAATLAAYPKDVPFALIYLIDADGDGARLACAAGVEPGAGMAPLHVNFAAGETPWPFADVLRNRGGELVRELAARFAAVPAGPWADPPNAAEVLTIPSGKPGVPAGFLIAGISSRLKLDERYRDFLDLVTSQLGAAIASATALEEERRRAEALAELDRAKTAFFNNVSHEFRTPLTLMLGPLEDGLADTEQPLSPAQRARQELVLRNGLRLHKLVNTLLDFARIEAGRAQASFVETDLATLTADLASSFRSAVEAAGLRLVVDCPPLEKPAFVDRDMWEKIVLNLLSNALKFTFAGEIRVDLREQGERIVLSVSDTGVGIEKELLPKIFERFYRVKNVRSRTHEGTGIGLALVQQLAALHGGDVGVESEQGRGTTFRVTLPSGRAHLPAEQSAPSAAASTGLGQKPFVEEVLRWTPEATPEVERPSRGSQARVLLADDNADMRDYLRGLLAPTYAVTTVADGQAALEQIRANVPDLVITDVMMPRLDGFGLVQALREDESTRTLPVLMLSARAGEEARVEGLASGIDDYLTKPFSARELLARVSAQLELARARRDAELELRRRDRNKDEFLATLAHELRNPLAPLRSGLHLLRVAGGDAPARDRVYDVMERQLSHLVRLVDDLLEVSRITRGKVDLRKERVDLADVVRGAVETSRPLIDGARHEISVELPLEPLPLEADAVRLSQVLANLLNNAAKYTRDGGRISVSAGRERGEAVVSVKDNGTGIPKDMLPRVFDLFTQVENSYARTQGGLGIGLTLAKSLVELHGGNIEAKSEGVGQGSEFIVRLPLADAGQVSAATASADAVPKVSRRILVVDDNHDAAEMMTLLLGTLGAEISVVHDGHAALGALKTYRPSVVLLDLGLPGMDGYEVARRMRAEPEGRAATLIALTGWGQEEDRRRSKEAGIDHHLVKPVDLTALHQLLAAS
jgi:signal transduction histidine kinase